MLFLSGTFGGLHCTVDRTDSRAMEPEDIASTVLQTQDANKGGDSDIHGQVGRGEKVESSDTKYLPQSKMILHPSMDGTAC